MARYYFNINDGVSRHDELGMDLASLAAAKCEAVRHAGRLICDHASRFWEAGDWVMTVTDEIGLTLFTLQLVGTESPAIRGLAKSLSSMKQPALRASQHALMSDLGEKLPLNHYGCEP